MMLVDRPNQCILRVMPCLHAWGDGNSSYGRLLLRLLTVACGAGRAVPWS